MRDIGVRAAESDEVSLPVKIGFPSEATHTIWPGSDKTFAALLEVCMGESHYYRLVAPRAKG